MEHMAFKQLIEDRQRKQRETLGIKAGEYAAEGDRLHNFKYAAQILGCTPEQALWGMAVKHLVCLLDWVKGGTWPGLDALDEKLGDMYNYLVLLEGLYIDKIDPLAPYGVPTPRCSNDVCSCMNKFSGQVKE